MAHANMLDPTYGAHVASTQRRLLSHMRYFQYALLLSLLDSITFFLAYCCRPGLVAQYKDMGKLALRSGQSWRVPCLILVAFLFALNFLVEVLAMG